MSAPRITDSHCHLDFPDFAPELDQVIESAREAGLRRMVTICTRVRKFDQVRAVAERYDDVFCSVGTHPHNAAEELDVPVAELVAMAQAPKVVAIGEAGLDYYYDKSPRDAQARGLRNHIAAARETLADGVTWALRGKAPSGVQTARAEALGELRPRST